MQAVVGLTILLAALWLVDVIGMAATSNGDGAFRAFAFLVGALATALFVIAAVALLRGEWGGLGSLTVVCGAVAVALLVSLPAPAIAGPGCAGQWVTVPLVAAPHYWTSDTESTVGASVYSVDEDSSVPCA